MIIASKIDDGIYLRLTTGVVEIHLSVYYDDCLAVMHVYRNNECILKDFGSIHDLLNKIRRLCGKSV